MEYIVKNITTIESGVIAHGVNCQGAMGSGVAKALKDKWPEIYDVYKRQPVGGGMLGKVTVILVDIAAPILVLNCYTQEFYGPGDKKYALPAAINTCIRQAYEVAQASNDLDLYLPKIGAGLGGLDWETEVLPIIEGLDNRYPDINTYICVIDEAEIP